MILFCGIPTESPLTYAIEAAEALGLEHIVFNQRHARFTDLSLDMRDGRATGAFWMWEREVSLDEFSGVYTRLIDPSQLPETRADARPAPDERLVAHSAFLHSTLNDWLEVAECSVVNRTSAMASNASKPFQAQHIVAAGFDSPDTLVTNDPGELRAFVRQHGRVIYKSVSGIRSIVRELGTDVSDAALQRLHNLPTQFQQFIDGTNVRVHVVGTDVFATEITSDAVDYRYAQRDEKSVSMSATTLPAPIADRCRALSSTLDLPLCGIDLKRASDGRYFCFEVNPSPAYSYYQENAGQPIAEALVRFLAA
jgi:glutathione synthase/RimK-type ligase-like ATP-grasp enzyme